MHEELPKKRPTVLTRLRIDEVSLVDRAAGHNCKVIISKRDDSADDNRPIEMPENERRYWAGLGATALRHAEERFRKENSTGADEHLPADDEPEIPPTPADDPDRFLFSKETFMRKAAPVDKMVGDASKKNQPITFDTVDGARMRFPDERSLAEWLAIQARIRKSTSEANTMTNPQDKLRDLAKRAGPVAIAKVIVEDDNAYGITEHELTSIVVECAKRDHPNLSDAQAFVRMFTDQSEAGVTLRKAFNVVKSAARSDNVTSYPFPKF